MQVSTRCPSHIMSLNHNSQIKQIKYNQVIEFSYKEYRNQNSIIVLYNQPHQQQTSYPSTSQNDHPSSQPRPPHHRTLHLHRPHRFPPPHPNQIIRPSDHRLPRRQSRRKHLHHRRSNNHRIRLTSQFTNNNTTAFPLPFSAIW